MSIYEYDESLRISAQDYPFYALIMAAFRQADTFNLAKLRMAFPAVWLEFEARYNAPGGLLEDELPETIMGVPVKVTEVDPEEVRGVLGLILGSFNDYDHRAEEEKEPGRSFTHKRPEPDTLPPTSRSKQEEKE